MGGTVDMDNNSLSNLFEYGLNMQDADQDGINHGAEMQYWN